MACLRSPFFPNPNVNVNVNARNKMSTGFLGWPCLQSGFHMQRGGSLVEQVKAYRGSITLSLSFKLQKKEQVERLVVRSSTATTNIGVGENRLLVFVPPHPLIKHWVSILRNELSPSPIFKSALAELGRLLIYEASRDWLVTISGEMQTPCGIAEVEFIDPRYPIQVIPILRAGLVLIEHVSSVLPATTTYHVGFSRDETTLKPNLYLNKLPDKFPDSTRVLVADPMLATGGTMVATLNLLKERNIDPKNIRVIVAVAAPPALTKLNELFPGLRVYAGILDPSVNEKGFIVPGFGDAGDRSFGT